MRRQYFNFERKFEYPVGLYINPTWNSAEHVMLGRDFLDMAYVARSWEPKEDYFYYVRADLLHEFIWNKSHPSLVMNNFEDFYMWSQGAQERFHHLYVSIDKTKEDEELFMHLPDYTPFVAANPRMLIEYKERAYNYIKLDAFKKYLEAKNQIVRFDGTLLDPMMCPIDKSDDNFPKDLGLRLHFISELKDNWDGYGAPAIKPEVVKAAWTFIETLTKYSLEIEELDIPTADDMAPAPDGCIDIDIEKTNNNKNTVCIWISSDKIGFFTDYEHGINFESDGWTTDFKTIDERLLKHLKFKKDFNGTEI